MQSLIYNFSTMNKFATVQTAHCQGNAAVSLLLVLYYCKLQRNLFEFVIRRSVIVEVSVENYVILGSYFTTFTWK